MNSALTIRNGQFPDAIGKDVTVGDTVRLVVTGRVGCIREDIIDVTGLNGPPQFVPGERETVVYPTVILDAS